MLIQSPRRLPRIIIPDVPFFFYGKLICGQGKERDVESSYAFNQRRNQIPFKMELLFADKLSVIVNCYILAMYAADIIDINLVIGGYYALRKRFLLTFRHLIPAEHAPMISLFFFNITSLLPAV